MQSVEIARRVPHAVHYCDPFSSHAPPWSLRRKGRRDEAFLDRVRELESPPPATPASLGKDKDQ